MARKPRGAAREIVPHPRYGSASTSSGYGFSEEEVRAAFYGYQDATIFADSAIPADVSRQNFTTMSHRGLYVDILKTCRDCARDFIFFAREQQYWYEVLRIYIDADCVRCPACRKSERELKRRFRRYSEAGDAKTLDDAALAALVDDAAFLWSAGILKNEQRLRRLRNLAQRRIPTTKEAKRIDELVREMGKLSSPVNE